MFRRTLAAVSVAAVLWGAANSLRATDNRPPAADAAPRISNEFAEILDVTKPDAATRARFLQQIALRQDALEKWDKSEEGRMLYELRSELQAARKTNDEGKIKLLGAQITALSAAESALKVKLRGAILGTLTLEQQKTWTAHILAVRVHDFLQNVALSNAQYDQLRALALQEAGLFLKSGTLEQDPYLIALKDTLLVFAEKVRTQVLTDAQRQMLKPPAFVPTVPVEALPATL